MSLRALVPVLVGKKPDHGDPENVYWNRRLCLPLEAKVEEFKHHIPIFGPLRQAFFGVFSAARDTTA
jgi:hypothetical protein